MIVTICKKYENAVNGVAQTGGGGSGGSTAVSRVLMPSTVVDGGDGDADASVDDDLFTEPTSENEHGISPP